MAILGKRLCRSCCPSPTTSVYSITDSSETAPVIGTAHMGGHSGPREVTIEWTEEAEKFFLQLLAEKVTRDPNGAPILKGSDWTNISAQIHLKFDVLYPPDKLKAKYHRLRNIHTKFNELVTQTGVTVDAATGTIFASEAIWADFLTRDKIFKTFKRKGCKLYELLGQVFSRSTASGAFHNASTADPVDSDEERRIEDSYLMGDEATAGGSGSKRKSGDAFVDDSIGQRRVSKRSSKVERYDSFLERWSKTLEARENTELLKQERYRSTATSSSADSKLACMEFLNATNGLSSKVYNAACVEFLNPEWRTIFLCMPEERRLGWLYSLD